MGQQSSSRPLKVLVACEFSGIVRDAFIARGHDAISVDLLPTERPGPHHQGNVIPFMRGKWDFDLMVAHPPCRYLAVSGARWFKDRLPEQEASLKFVPESRSIRKFGIKPSEDYQ